MLPSTVSMLEAMVGAEPLAAGGAGRLAAAADPGGRRRATAMRRRTVEEHGRENLANPMGIGQPTTTNY